MKYVKPLAVMDLLEKTLIIPPKIIFNIKRIPVTFNSFKTWDCIEWSLYF